MTVTKNVNFFPLKKIFFLKKMTVTKKMFMNLFLKKKKMTVTKNVNLFPLKKNLFFKKMTVIPPKYEGFPTFFWMNLK